MMIAQAARTFDINNLKYEFKVDKEAQTVTFGNLIIGAGVDYNAKDIVRLAKLGTNKKGYQEFNSRYDFPAKRLAKYVNRTFMEMLVDPVRKYSTRYAFTYSGPSIYLIRKIHEVKPILDQCELDGIENIQPICLLLGKDPAGCKLELGKPLWKKLCKNSLTRNTYLYKSLRTQTTFVDVLDGLELRGKYVGDELEELNQFKSKYLKRGRNISKTHVRNFNRYGFWVQETGGDYSLAVDTERMAHRLDEKFSLAWSKEKMSRKHNEYSLELQLQREKEMLEKNANYNRQWASLNKYLPCETIEFGGYTATLIKTPSQLHLEGEVMRHCVGSYSDRVRDGEYLVYSITDSAGERVSTLGLRSCGLYFVLGEWCIDDHTEEVPPISPHSESGYQIDQHYGKYNSRVTEENALQLADLVVSSLNKLLKDEQKTK